MNRIQVTINNLAQVLLIYDKIKVYRANTENGSYAEITDADTRLSLIAEQRIYFYSDDSGISTHWYKTSYYNSTTFNESALSESQQGGTEDAKIGYTFNNYGSPPNEWGKALTPDDLRYHFIWGVDMVASDELGSEIADEQLDFCIENAVNQFEHHFDFDIRKRVYKTQPDDDLTQAVKWITGVDYTDEDDPYDFNINQWINYGFIQLRHKPIISVESALLFSPWDQQVLDIITWIRIYKKVGQLGFFPTGQTLSGLGYAGTGMIAAFPHIFGANYPQAFKIDYTTGYKSSNFISKDLRNAIGMLATLNALGWIGDGLLAGFSSASVSLDGLSESFSSTQSATSAYFGARIKSYTDQLKEFVKHNRLKYGNINMGMISGR